MRHGMEISLPTEVQQQHDGTPQAHLQWHIRPFIDRRRHEKRVFQNARTRKMTLPNVNHTAVGMCIGCAAASF
jgi:hypothetical protein